MSAFPALRQALVLIKSGRKSVPNVFGQTLRRFQSSERGGGGNPAKNATNSATLTELYMRALEPKPPQHVPMPQAEKKQGRELAKLYTQGLWRRRRMQMKDLTRKLQLKWAAIYALPTPELRAEALFVDPYVPLDLRLATDTPPLLGFSDGGQVSTSSGASQSADELAKAKKAAPVVSAKAASINAAALGKMAKSSARDEFGAYDEDTAPPTPQELEKMKAMLAAAEKAKPAAANAAVAPKKKKK
jgi:hypothetical protein